MPRLTDLVYRLHDSFQQVVAGHKDKVRAIRKCNMSEGDAEENPFSNNTSGELGRGSPTFLPWWWPRSIIWSRPHTRVPITSPQSVRARARETSFLSMRPQKWSSVSEQKAELLNKLPLSTTSRSTCWMGLCENGSYCRRRCCASLFDLLQYDS